MKKIIALSSLSAFAPLVAFAQTSPNFTYINNTTTFLKTLLNWVIPVLITLMVIYFLWSLISFIRSEPKEKEEKKKGLLWSVLALFIGISIFGIIAILQRVTGTQGVNKLDSNSIPTITW